VRDIDALQSFTLEQLRDRWWDAGFADFLRDTLRPQPGERVLDVGCGAAPVALVLGQAQTGCATLVAIDVRHARVRHAGAVARQHGIAATFSTAEASHLPFAAASFDAGFAVAVLQHVERPDAAVRELSRVMRPGGRVVVVEPDNDARYWFSEPPSGAEAFKHATSFYRAADAARLGRRPHSLGPRLPSLLHPHGLDAIAVHVFPVSVTRLGAPLARIWDERRHAVDRVLRTGADEERVRLGHRLREALELYASDAARAGPRFVEIQTTLLFATVAQKRDGA
jgi:SAM-dependent methyltransferase